MNRRQAVRRLIAQRHREAELCRVSDHLGAGPLLRYGADRYGSSDERCPYCYGRIGVTETMTVCTETWKEEYAESLGTKARRQQHTRFVVHHVHPHLPGIAHCLPDVQLNMDTLTSTRPPAADYCSKCRVREDWYRQRANSAASADSTGFADTL